MSRGSSGVSRLASLRTAVFNPDSEKFASARPSIGRKGVWLIRDGRHDFATGCVGSPADKGPPEAAQQALGDYIAKKYRPTRKARDIEQIDIADVLSIYLDDCGDEQADRKKFQGRISRLNSFWGGRMLSDVSTATSVQSKSRTCSRASATNRLRNP